MRKLRAEMHRRMLGNGYCARPSAWTATSNRSANRAPTFRPRTSSGPRSKRQRDDAAEKGQVGRLKIFDGLLDPTRRPARHHDRMPDRTVFEVAANPDPDSTLPFLIRLPLPDGELVLKARDSWPRTAKVYCHRAETLAARARDRRARPDPLLPTPWRRDRPRARPPAREPLPAGVHPHPGRPRGDLLAVSAHHPPSPARDPRSPPARRRARAPHDPVDTRERYPYKFAQQQASTERPRSARRRLRHRTRRRRSSPSWSARVSTTSSAA